ncbi:MAG: hypothetical protein K6343_00940 [Caldisericaceae bacterium]
MKEQNISLFESIVRVVLGVGVFVLGYKITDFNYLYLDNYYPKTFLFNTIYRFHNIFQILCLVFGFILFFTGITRFSVVKEIIRRTRRKT